MSNGGAMGEGRRSLKTQEETKYILKAAVLFDTLKKSQEIFLQLQRQRLPCSMLEGEHRGHMSEWEPSARFQGRSVTFSG